MTVQHQARKRFGQNFLVDQEIIRQIIAAIGPKPEDNLIEIGPGTAALTEHLIPQCPTMRVVELDRDLVAYLSEKFAAYPDFQIFSGDALKTDFTQFYEGRPMRLVGNLPYNISTPILFHLIKVRELIQDMHFMLQSEVVDRLTAVPHTKAWGRLGILAQYLCRVERVLDVPPEAFDPPPKVQSAVVKLIPKPVEQIDKSQLERLQVLVKQAFSQRRKTLRNTLKGWVDDRELERFGSDPSSRAETISLDQWIQLSDGIEQ